MLGSIPLGRPAAAGTWPALTVRRVRLITGLWLLFYATGHLLNHALGLVSLAAAEEGRALFLGFWRTPPSKPASPWRW